MTLAEQVVAGILTWFQVLQVCSFWHRQWSTNSGNGKYIKD